MINRIFRRVSGLADALNDSAHGARVLETVSRRGFAAVIALSALTGIMGMSGPPPSRRARGRPECDDEDCDGGECGANCEDDEGHCHKLPTGDPPGAHCWCANELKGKKYDEFYLMCDCLCNDEPCYCMEEKNKECNKSGGIDDILDPGRRT